MEVTASALCGAEGQYHLISGALHGVALRSPGGKLVPLPKAVRWAEVVEAELIQVVDHLPEARERGVVAEHVRQEERIGETVLWVLPNPSGLNANYQAAALARLFRELREYSLTGLQD